MKKTLLKNLKFLFLIPIILVSIFYFVHINQFVIISSNSMVPSLNTGDLIYYESKYYTSDYGSINVDAISGDILVIRGARYFYENGVDPFLFAYLSDNIPIVHRAINKYYNESSEMWYFVMKGDNNEYSDGSLRGLIEDGFGEFILNQSDPLLIPQTEIIGIVKFVLPRVGYIGMYFPIILSVFITIILLYIVSRISGYQIKIYNSKINESR
jgi:signal peptidase I